MTTYIVRLNNGMIGYVTSVNPPFTGYEMTVTIIDEHGDHIQVTDVVEEVLGSKPPWE